MIIINNMPKIEVKTTKKPSPKKANPSPKKAKSLPKPNPIQFPPVLKNTLYTYPTKSLTSSFKNHPDKLLLRAYLDQFSKSFYEPSELKTLTDSKVYVIDKDHQKVRDKNGKSTKQCRFRMFIGSTTSIDNALLPNVVSAEQSHEVYHDNFKNSESGGIRSALSTFYNSVFADTEKKSIEKSLKQKNAHHLVIFGRKVLSKRLTPDKYFIEDSIVAATTFILHPKNTLLLWIAVSVDTFGESWSSDIANLTFTTNFKLGSFMVATVQQLSQTIYSHCTLCCQVMKDPFKGPLSFYLKNHFKPIIDKEDKFVKSLVQFRFFLSMTIL